MKIRDIMTTDVELVHPDTTLRDAAQKMRDADTGFCRWVRTTGWSEP